jgi:adenylate cyclase
MSASMSRPVPRTTRTGRDRAERKPRGSDSAKETSNAGARAGGRRLAAIAFVDIVGYSILVAQQEAATLARWMALLQEIIHPELTRHHGTYIKSTGDGLLAEFPSALDGVNWARDVQRAVSLELAADAAGAPPPLPIALRIAVHVGDIVSDGKGDIFGDGVNVAARLQEFAEPGGIALSAMVHDLIRGHLDRPARDLGLLSLKNFERPVHAFMIEPAAPGFVVPTLAGHQNLPSIAVLPLQNLSNDPSENYFCEGIVEDIVTSLAGLRELFVISRNSTLGLARANADLREIGRALAVRYVLTGSVRRSPQRVRVNVQLADSTTGARLWAKSFDAPITELFEQQDNVVEEIVAGIAPHIQSQELRRAMRKRPDNFNAYDLTLQAINLTLGLDPGTFATARTLFDRAIAEDQLFAMPHAWLAQWYSINVGQGWSSSAAADIQSAIEMSQRAIALDGDNARALAINAHLRSYHFHDYDSALAGFDRALASCPNLALAWTLSGATLSYVGRGEEAVKRTDRGLRLSPFDSGLFYSYSAAAWARYALGAHEEALKCARMSAIENPRFTSNLRLLAAIQETLGLHEDARTTAKEMLRLEPGFSVGQYLRTRQPFRDPVIRERFVSSIANLGLPS